jgi:hypothetical protein
MVKQISNETACSGKRQCQFETYTISQPVNCHQDRSRFESLQTYMRRGDPLFLNNYHIFVTQACDVLTVVRGSERGDQRLAVFK